MSQNARIFGVDPGTHTLGYGVLEWDGRSFRFRAAGAVRGGKRADARAARLQTIYRGLRELLKKWRPSVFVLEEVFYGKSIEAAIRLGEARGIALLAAGEQGIPIAEYSPAVVKKAVVGYGRADKTQVAAMVQAILGLPAPPEPLDASDALALAICHTHRQNAPGTAALPLATSPPQE